MNVRILKKITLFLSLILLTTCDMFQVGLGEQVDIEAPEIECESHGNGEYVGGSITLSGTVTDDQGVDSVWISDGSQNFQAEIEDGQWSVELDTTQYPDGDQEFLIIAQDFNDRRTQKEIFLVLDNRPPTVIVTTPPDYGNDVEFNKTLVIKGEASDSVRVRDVRISIYDAQTNDLLVDDEPAIGSSSWYYSIDTTQAPNGLYYLFVKATDWSGNSNSYFYHFKDLLALANDPQDVPSIEEVDGADNQGVPLESGVLSADISTIRASTTSGERVFAAINQNSDLPQFSFTTPSGSLNPGDNVFATTQRFNGFVLDDDGVDNSSVEIAIWNNSDNFLVDPPLIDWVQPEMSGTLWTYNANLVDGVYQLFVRARDIYGYPAEALVSNPAPFTVSSLAPIVVITSPSQGSYVGPSNPLDLVVNVSNLGTGSAVEVDPDGDGTFGANTLSLSDAGGGNYSISMVDGVDYTLLDGAQFMKVRAGIPGSFGYATLQYTGDIQNPQLSIEYPLEGDAVNGQVNIAGISSDDHLIRNVYLWLEDLSDGATAPPAALNSWNGPDGSDVYNWIWAMDTEAMPSGNYRIHGRVADAAGNLSSAEVVNFQVDQESDRPVISFSNITEGSSSNGLGRDAAIIGSIEDDDKVDSVTLEIRVDVYNDGLFTGVDLTGNSNTLDENESETWIPIVGDIADVRILNWTYDLLNLPQGEHSIQVRVHDVDSNGTANEGANSHYSETLITPIVIDYGPPDLTIQVPPNGSLHNVDFDISGTATDPNNIRLVEISLDNGTSWSALTSAQTLVSGVPTDLSLLPSSPVDWAYNFVVPGDGSADGEYFYQVRATDSSDAKTTLDRQLIVDATSPIVSISNPANSETINGVITINGDSADVMANGYIGTMSTVYLNILPSTSPAPSFPGDYTDLNSHPSWAYSYDSTAVAEDDYILRVVSEDKAGNASAVSSILFTVDQNSDRPVITFNDLDKDETDGTLNVLVGATALTGNVVDDDGIDPSLFVQGGGALPGAAVEINLDNGGWLPVSQQPNSNGYWKHDLGAITEGLHHVKVRARDVDSDGTVGASSIAAEYGSNYNWEIEDSTDQNGVPFILNLGPPSITITAPANYSYHSSDVTISGGAADANGIKTVEISYDNGSSWTTIIPDDTIYNSPEPWSTVFAVTGSNDGTVAYIVRVIDAYDSTGIENGQFTVDAEIPTVNIELPALSSTVNGTMTIKGQAGDNIQLDQVFYDIRLNSAGAPAFPADYILLTGTYSWTEDINTIPLADNLYTLRVMATDKAGNQSLLGSRDFTINQESDRPVVTLINLTGGGSFADNLLAGSLQISGLFSDDDGLHTPSLSYSLYDSAGLVTLKNWTAVDSPGSTWLTSLSTVMDVDDLDTDGNTTELIPIQDGTYQIQFRGSDINDNGNFTPGGFGWVETANYNLAVDRANPVTSFDPVNGNAGNGGYTNYDLLIGGTATDDNGVAAVHLTFDGGTTWLAADSFDSGTGVWSHSWPIDDVAHSDDGILNYSVRITDNFQKQQVYDRYINIDTQVPTLDSLVLVNNDTNPGEVNGSLLFQGFPLDNETLVDSIYVITTATLPGSMTDPSADPTIDGWTLLGSSNSVNHRINTTLMADGVYYTYFILDDIAGNRTATTGHYLSYEVVQANNLPVITLDTLNGAVLSSSGSITGNALDDDGINASTLEISVDGGTSWTSVSNPGSNSTSVDFSHSLAALTERLAAYDIRVQGSDLGEDFTDNSQDIPVVSNTNSEGVISIYIDNSNPSAAITSLSNGKESSGTITGLFVNDYFLIGGTATDGVQVAEVRAKLSGDANFTDHPVTNTGTNYSTWNWTRSGLSLSGDTEVMTLQVEDVHGNTTSYNYTLLVDTLAPTVTFSSSSTNPDTDFAEYGVLRGRYNQTVTFSGEVSDNNQVSKVYYLIDQNALSTTTDPTPGGDNWTEATGTYNWTVDFNSTTVADGSTNYLHICAIDRAGNLSTVEHLSFVVHQDSDTPVLTISQPVNNDLLESNPRVTGTVRDDDGLSAVQIQIDTNDDGTYEVSYTAVDSPSTVSGKYINLEHDLSAYVDGPYRIQLRASDTVDNGNFNTIGAVTGSEISFDIDRALPLLSLDEILIYDRYPGNPGTSNQSITSSFNGSYVNNDFDLEFTASDANGIQWVQTSINGGAWVNATANGGNSYTADMSIVGFSQGTNTIAYQAEDSHGKVSSYLLTIIVDTNEPIVSFTDPASVTLDDHSLDAPNVNGDVIIRGSVSDGSSIASVDLMGGIDSVNFPVPLTNTGNNISWITTLASSGNYTTTDYSYNTGDTGANSWDGVDDGDEIWTNIWRFPVEVSTADIAGNITVTTGYLDIDPASDKPEATIVSPSNGGSLSGTFLINGTITDDDGTKEVRLQFDLDDDGVFDKDTPAVSALTLSNDLTVYGLPGNDIYEVTEIPLPAANGSWSILLTASDFTDALITAAGYTTPNNGFISMRVTPYDIYDTPGDPQDVRVYLDNSKPTIRGLDTDGITEVAEPTPATGTLQNGTITLRAVFQDDMALSNDQMKISTDGGATFTPILTQFPTATIADQGGYKYYVTIPMDSSTVVSGGNGLLNIQLSVSDQTNKETSKSISYSVDNSLPVVRWNRDGLGTLLDLPFIGTPPNEIYSFKGNESTLATDDAFKVLGSATDSGTISGIARVDVYFVKGGNFHSPVDSVSYPPAAVSNQTIADDTGTDQSIPFTDNSNYVIRIDNRIEQGQYDGVGGIGDGDGFNESLKAKSGYDEWYAFYDTTELPDGPLTIYAVAYDEAGNRSYTMASAQIANHPPTIPSIDVAGTTINDSNDKVKVSGDPVTFTINTADAEWIDVDTISMEVVARYQISAGYPGAEDTGYTPTLAYVYADFDTAPGSDGTTAQYIEAFNSLGPDATGGTADDPLPSGYYYEYLVEVQDGDGNLVTRNFFVWVNNEDSSPPNVTIDAFTQSHAGSSGHIEEASNSPGDSDADLSGTITVTGTADDDTAVTLLNLEYSTDGGSNWNTLSGSASLTQTGGDLFTGPEYSWSYTWNTNGLGGIEDLLLRAYGTDGTNTTLAVNRPSRQLDLRPYISEIQTGLDNNLLKPARRSVRGWYPVRVGQTVTIRGYNLPQTGNWTDAVTVGGTALTPTGGDGSYLTLPLGAVDTSGQVVVLNGTVSSQNHLNDNSLSQNKEANLYNSSLTDDRFLAFFQLDTSSYNGIDAVMRANLNGSGARTGTFDWLYVKNNVELYYNANQLSFSFKLNGGDFDINSSGTPAYIFLNDSNAVDDIADQDYFFYGSVLWGLGNQSYTTASYNSYYAMDWNVDDYPTLGVGNLSFVTGPNYTDSPYTNTKKMSRYENLRIITSGNDADMINYVFYFDNDTTIPTTVPATTEPTRSIVFYSYHTGTTAGIGTAMGNYGGSPWYTELDESNDTNNPFKYNNGGNKTGIATPNGRVNLTSGSADSAHFAPYLDSSNRMHLIYWDEVNNQLLYIYDSTPYRDPTIVQSAPVDGSTVGWSTPLVIDSDAGQYPDIVVDSSGGIHMVYQDSANSTVKYAYLSSYTDTTPDLRHVDGLFGAGSYNSISLKEDFDLDGDGLYDNVALNESENIERPLITTYAGGLSGTNYSVKMAFPLHDPGSIQHGFDPNNFEYTGDWEVMVVPASTRPSASRTFAETSGLIVTEGNPIAGYNGNFMETARLLALD